MLPDIGLAEIFIVLVVALLVIGPKDLPAVARKIGQWVGAAQRMFHSARNDFLKALDDEEKSK